VVEPIPPTSKNLRYSFLILGPGYIFPNMLKQKYVRVLFVLQASGPKAQRHSIVQ
jgi:hypothetical protein